MKAADLKQASDLSKRLLAFGHVKKQKRLPKKRTSFSIPYKALNGQRLNFGIPQPVRPTRLSPFTFDYDALKEPEEVRLTRETKKISEQTSRTVGELAKSILTIVERLEKTESVSNEAIQTAAYAIDLHETLLKNVAEVKPPEIKEVEKIIEKTIEPFVLSEEIVRDIVQMMHKLPDKDKLEVSKGIRNAQSFIFGKTKYKIEELMHGGGSTSSSGSGYQQPLTGVVNGVNQIFTWTTAPNVIVVDQGRPMQKVSSDGTVNWTGTTTTTLAVAPNFDIFASA